MLSLKEIIELPDGVAEDMLKAEAKVVEEAQIYVGFQKGVYRTGMTLSSITHGKLKRTKDGKRAIYVYPRGTNDKGVRNAEVAFINEYGKGGKDGRQFIRTANELSADAAVEEAARVYDDFLRSKDL